MSAFTTREITRDKAIDLIGMVAVKVMREHTNAKKELDEVLNDLANDREHEDILGVLINFKIK